MDPISTSLINNALWRMDRVSAGIAAGPAAADLPRDMVDMSRSAHEVKINVATVRACDEMLGSLVDMMA